MPYIQESDREKYDADIYRLLDSLGSHPGHLNYIITKLLLGSRGESYTEYNEALGILSAVSHEFYRRHVAPYEDLQLERNGDV